MTGTFIGAVLLASTSMTTPVDNAPIYRLLEPLTYITADGREITAPAGFLTDLASVPPVFWDEAPPNGPWAPAAIIHDYEYTTHTVTRREADETFQEGLRTLGVGERGQNIMFTMVRLFGAKAWVSYIGWRPE